MFKCECSCNQGTLVCLMVGSTYTAFIFISLLAVMLKASGTSLCSFNSGVKATQQNIKRKKHEAKRRAVRVCSLNTTGPPLKV